MKAMFYQSVVSLSMLFLVNYSHAQQGVVFGKITDNSNGDELIGATVLVKELGTGTTADLDGNFNLPLVDGNYTLVVSYVSYTAMTIENVAVVSGASQRLNIAMEPNAAVLRELVVEASQVRSSEIAILSMQRKSATIQDGISSTEMSTMGISDAAQALTQVTGATVEEGKYLVVRGLGDRYSLSLLDGMVMPSVDPVRNSSSLDLIPAGMIENLVIRKTYTPDLPGNFSGGLAEVSTKSIPEEFYLDLGISMGFNTRSTFNPSFLRDKARGSWDWLGYDDGSRALPEAVLQYAQHIKGGGAQATATAGRQLDGEQMRHIIDATSDAFSTSFVADQISPGFNRGLNIALGNRYRLGDGGQLLGLNIGVNYDRSFQHVENGVFNTYSTNTDETGKFQPNIARQFNQTESTENVESGAMIGLTYQFHANHRLTLKNLYNHQGSYNAINFNGFYPEAISSSNAEFYSHNVGYTEKMLNYTGLSGQHHFKSLDGLDVHWSVNYNANELNQPDQRLFAYVVEAGDYSIRRSETAGDPRRFFRQLSDNQLSGKVDFSLPVAIGNRKLELKWGGYFQRKDRDFSERYYDIPLTNENFTNPSFVTFGEANGDFDLFFGNQNMGFTDTPHSNGTNLYGFGNIYREMTIPSNQYIGNETIIAGYLMGSYNITTNLRVIAGLRVESTDLTTRNEGPPMIDVQNPENPLETMQISSNGNVQALDFLPSLNLVYNLSDNTNIRGAFSQTLARPNMREISPFRSLGSIGADIVIGNPQLERTLIQNVDLRLETYPRPGEVIAVSAYYKQFTNPIIVNIYSTGSAIEQQPNNVDEAVVYGAEFEFRKKLDFLSESLESLKFGFNAAVIYSKVNKTQRELNQIEGFVGAENIHSNTRPFQGQSPYIVNAVISHNSDKLRWENSLRFNIWGRRLSYQTPAQIPDVYEVSRPSLDFTSTKRVGKHFTLSLKVMNLLDMEFRQEFDFDMEGVDNTYRSFRIGRTFSLGISYSI